MSRKCVFGKRLPIREFYRFLAGGGLAFLWFASPLAHAQIAEGLRFVPIAPCRVMDTRGPVGPFGSPAIGVGQARVLPLASAVPSPCGLPINAKAWSINLTVCPHSFTGPCLAGPTTPVGNISLYPKR